MRTPLWWGLATVWVVSCAVVYGDDPLRFSPEGKLSNTKPSSEIEIIPGERKRPATPQYMESSEYDGWIEDCANKYGLQSSLIKAVIEVESNWDHRAVSSKGAMGLMQLMPETARILGVRDPFDPRENIDGGSRYLAEQLATFGGDVQLALAAYNAGPTVVSSVKRVPRIRETERYVKKVLKILGPVGGFAGSGVPGAYSRPSLEPGDHRYDYRYWVFICELDDGEILITNLPILKGYWN
jgi:hypothetical protein